MAEQVKTEAKPKESGKAKYRIKGGKEYLNLPRIGGGLVVSNSELNPDPSDPDYAKKQATAEKLVKMIRNNKMDHLIETF